MSGLSEAGRRSLAAELRVLQSISPWPGLLHLAVRLSLQVALSVLAWRAWVRDDDVTFVAWGLPAALCFSSLLVLSHDALHHRLTGIGWVDEMAGRAISWPIAWPITTYKYVHLLHHRLSGRDFGDPERISPRASDWQASGWRRSAMRHQLWLRMFVTGAFGLLVTLLANVSRRFSDRVVRRAFIVDAVGILAAMSMLVALASRAQGLHGVLGLALLWLMHERMVGVMHQFRVHMEHYGLWGEGGAFMDTQYLAARTIRTSFFLRLYFNHLSRHAEHHVAPAIPFYKLERAHGVIADAYRREGFVTVETNGYFAALREVTVQMRACFAADGIHAKRLRKVQDLSEN